MKRGTYLITVWVVATILALSGCGRTVDDAALYGYSNSVVGNNALQNTPSGQQGGQPGGQQTQSDPTFVPPAPHYCFADSQISQSGWNPGVTSDVTSQPAGDFMYISENYLMGNVGTAQCQYKIQDLLTQTDYVLLCSSNASMNFNNNENLIPGWTITTHLVFPDAGSFGCYYSLVPN